MDARKPAAELPAACPLPKQMTFFDRYLSLWAALAMGVGVPLGRAFPSLTAQLSRWQFVGNSQVNIPIAVLIWRDFAAIWRVRKHPTGLFVTLFVNWLVKPFTIACFAWLFFRHLFAADGWNKLARRRGKVRRLATAGAPRRSFRRFRSIMPASHAAPGWAT